MTGLGGGFALRWKDILSRISIPEWDKMALKTSNC